MCDSLVCWRLFRPTERRRKDRDESEYGESVGVERHDGCDEGLVRASLLMLLMLSQESFQEILAFSLRSPDLMECLSRLPTASFAVSFNLLMEFPRQASGVFTY